MSPAAEVSHQQQHQRSSTTTTLSVRRPRRQWGRRRFARRSIPGSSANDDNEEILAASKKTVDAMQRVTVTGHDQDCVICMEELEVGDEATKLPCDCKDTYFHSLCLQTWLPKSASCPLCRFAVKLVTDSDDDEDEEHQSDQQD